MLLGTATKILGHGQWFPGVRLVQGSRDVVYYISPSNAFAECVIQQLLAIKCQDALVFVY